MSEYPQASSTCAGVAPLDRSNALDHRLHRFTFGRVERGERLEAGQGDTMLPAHLDHLFYRMVVRVVCMIPHLEEGFSVRDELGALLMRILG